MSASAIPVRKGQPLRPLHPYGISKMCLDLLAREYFLDYKIPAVNRELAAAGAIIDGVYYCSHEVQPPCDCRKPEPGMLLSAPRHHQLDLAASWMIADSEVDVTAGKKAGCKTARLTEIDKGPNGNADVIAPSLIEAVRQILSISHISCDNKK